MISTIERPNSTPPSAGTHFDAKLLSDEMASYPAGRPFWIPIFYPQGSKTSIESGMSTVTPGKVVRSYPQGGTTSIESEAKVKHFRFYLYDHESSAAVIVLVDDQSEEPKVWSPDDNEFDFEFDFEYQRVIDDLRNGGRELVAEELIAILRNSLEDPEEPEVKLFSLRSMARFLVSNRHVANPMIGPDPGGIMQIEWHIDGNGLLVMAFLEDDEIHFIAQADETSSCQAVNESVLVSVNQVVEDYGHLVPFRYA